MRRLLITGVVAVTLLGSLTLFRDAGAALMAAALVGSAAALQPEQPAKR